MAGPTREVVISYGTFDSNDTDWHLNGAETIQLDERTFTCVYDVVCVGSNAAAVDTAVTLAEAQLNQRHQDFKIVVDGNTLFHFGDGVDGVGANIEGAEFIKADWRCLGTHRSKKSRAYRVTVEVTRAALQTGKIGVYEQSIRVTTNSQGKRHLSFQAQFTPGPDNTETGTALERYGDATYGFDALVSAIQTTLTGAWERVGALSQSYDEDHRTLTARAGYEELKYAQSQTTGDLSGTPAYNDAALVGANYDIRVERKSAFTIPGRLTPRPFSAVTVLFSSGIVFSETQDLNDVIKNKILPYCKDVVSTALQGTSRNAPVLLGHGLRGDPVDNRVAGQVFFLVQESSVLEISKRLADVARTGDVYVPILSGGKWDRDKHTGPGQWLRRVVIACRVVGLDADKTLKSIEEDEKRKHEQNGFAFTGWAVNSSPSVEQFLETGGGSITTTVQTRVLEFERADIRGPDGIASGTRRRVTPSGEYAGTQERS